MTKQETDTHNLACLSAHMDRKGIPLEDRDKLPFGEDAAGDLISRSAFCAQLEKSQKHYDEIHRTEYHAGFVKARVLAAKIPAANKWISVEERLPPINCVIYKDHSEPIVVWTGSEVIDGVRYMDLTGEFMATIP